jgi:phosphoglycerate dehydrogenase-like enzyme
MTTLAVQHHLPPYIISQSHSSWDRGPHESRVTYVRELRGSTMGVLGYGHIGRECARMAKAMGMEVVVATRSGKKSGIGGYLVDGTGDHEGGEYHEQMRKDVSAF